MAIHPRQLLAPAALAATLIATRPLSAQIGVGTWERNQTSATPVKLTMTVTACCGKGRRLVYHMDINGTVTTMTVDSKFDGSEAPVLLNGQPSGETMAITWIDDHHTKAVLTLNGKPFGTAKSALSADGKTLTVDDDFSASVGGQPAGKFTEIWVRH